MVSFFKSKYYIRPRTSISICYIYRDILLNYTPPSGNVSKVENETGLVQSVRKVETWIQNLMYACVPVPGVYTIDSNFSLNSDYLGISL